LLGAGIGDLASWQTWISVLKATFGLPLDGAEGEVFRRVAGDRPAPSKPVRELWCVVARRSGKSRIAAALAVFEALFRPHKLSKGETGFVVVLAGTQDQSRTVFEYCAGFISASDALHREVASITASEIRLRNDVIIAVHTNSFRSIRGKTLLACIFDECSFWRSEESANPDVEVYRACMPSLIASNGMLIGISTPYRKMGLLHTKHRDHFGHDGDDVLVVQGNAATFNPTLSAQLIEAHRQADPEAATSEWDAEFRSDISAFLSDDLIELAVDRDRPPELPPQPKTRYTAFADPSGGRGDAFALCIGHRDGDRFIADVVRAAKPPFDPSAVTKEYAALAKDYRITTVRGDAYAGEWVSSAFKDAGLRYEAADRPKSQLYLESLPLWTRGLISIPDHQRLLRELRLLERRTHRSGKDTVDHGRAGHDDAANALCGAAVFAVKRGAYRGDMSWVISDEELAADRRAQSFQQDRFMQHVRVHTGYYNASPWRRPW
jgi:hypothetical protein